jgi:hypothetical protein
MTLDFPVLAYCALVMNNLSLINNHFTFLVRAFHRRKAAILDVGIQLFQTNVLLAASVRIIALYLEF